MRTQLCLKKFHSMAVRRWRAKAANSSLTFKLVYLNIFRNRLPLTYIISFFFCVHSGISARCTYVTAQQQKTFKRTSDSNDIYKQFLSFVSVFKCSPELFVIYVSKRALSKCVGSTRAQRKMCDVIYSSFCSMNWANNSFSFKRQWRGRCKQNNCALFELLFS